MIRSNPFGLIVAMGGSTIQIDLGNIGGYYMTILTGLYRSKKSFTAFPIGFNTINVSHQFVTKHLV
jgi:hypothetical protein